MLQVRAEQTPHDALLSEWPSVRGRLFSAAQSVTGLDDDWELGRESASAGRRWVLTDASAEPRLRDTRPRPAAETRRKPPASAAHVPLTPGRVYELCLRSIDTQFGGASACHLTSAWGAPVRFSTPAVRPPSGLVLAPVGQTALEVRSASRPPPRLLAPNPTLGFLTQIQFWPGP